MKKILLATTMLVGTAGSASAEVTLSGNARMGIYNNGVDTTFNSRVRASVSMSSETDGGLAFGGSFGIHDAGAAAAGTAGSVYISGAFGKLSMGDTSSAAENAVGDLAGVGYTGLDFSNENLFIATGDNETVLYPYTAGDLTVFASMGQRGDAAFDEVEDEFVSSGENYSVGAAYKTDAFGVHLGYENVDDLVVDGALLGDTDHIIGAVTASVGGIDLKAVYGTADLEDAGIDFEQSGVSASYTMDAMTVAAFYRTTDLSDAISSAETKQFGLGVSYDLGGGATVAGGIVNAERDASPLNGAFDDTICDLGVKFSF